jgi:site-specific recombinase XerD
LNDEGDRLNFHGLRQIIIRLSKRAGILYQGVHSFRRCFTLTLWKKKVDLLTISRLLGHSNLSVTTRYLNVGNSDLMENHNQNSPAEILNNFY